MQITLVIDTNRPTDIAEAQVLLSTLEAATAPDVPAGTMTADDAEFLRQLKMDAVAVREDAPLQPMRSNDPPGWTAPPPPADPDPRVVFAQPDVDAAGVKWDPALHASTKAKNMDGTWKVRKRRGSAEAAPPVSPPPPPPPTDTVSVPPPPPVIVPDAPAPPPAVAAVVPAGPRTFREVMKRVTDLKVSTQRTGEFMTALGFAPDALYALVKPENADKLAAFDAMVDTCAATA